MKARKNQQNRKKSLSLIFIKGRLFTLPSIRTKKILIMCQNTIAIIGESAVFLSSNVIKEVLFTFYFSQFFFHFNKQGKQKNTEKLEKTEYEKEKMRCRNLRIVFVRIFYWKFSKNLYLEIIRSIYVFFLVETN